MNLIGVESFSLLVEGENVPAYNKLYQNFQKMKQLFDKLQGWLSFSGCTNHQFIENGIGKIGTTGFVVGFLGGFHLALFFCASFCQMYIFNSTAVQIVTIWSAYFTLLCAYHFLEFFITAVKQPDVVSYESFVVNHGNNYSMAVCKYLCFSC